MKKVLSTILLVSLVVLAFGAAGWLSAIQRRSDPGAQHAADYPPGVRFVTVALGGFRGLLADALWLRAAQKQEEGLFFEVAQLSEWIARLEPRSPEIWIYHSWNMAYNIGAMFPDAADRWQWVQRGVRLLRDEGLAANPGSAKLYWELAWLYSDKVSGRWDADPLYSRLRLAAEMNAVLGWAGPAGKIGDEPWRREKLEGAGLAVDVMRDVEREYGVMDWRLPEAHALYWGFRGRGYQDPRAPWCDRAVWISLMQMVGAGELFFDPLRRIYVQGPRLDLARRWVRSGRLADVAKAPLTAAVAENFLRESMVMLHVFGDEAAAEEARVALAGLPGVHSAGGRLDAAVGRDLEERVRGMTVEQARGMLMDILIRGEQWRSLSNTFLADGFDRLAEHYKEAFERVMGTEAAELGGQWDAMRDEVKQRAGANR